MLKSIFHLFIIGVLTCTVASAQDISNYRFETINSFSGLPNNVVWDVMVDEFGFIWAATADGLCRIETSDRIKIFESDNNPYLKSNNIRNLFSDSKGNIWIGTKNSGLTLYIPKSDEWRYYSHDGDDPTSLVNNEILSITEDGQGNIWIGTEYGFSIYNYGTDSFINYNQDSEGENQLSSKAILNII